MEKFIVNGPSKLTGDITIAGAKNVALKALVASLLTDDLVTIKNIPHIRDVHLMIEVLESVGKKCTLTGSTIRIAKDGPASTTVLLELGARLRASSMAAGPLLSRFGSANIPNPGGCRIGARPIDRHIEGLKAMGAKISYHSDDGFFHATVKQMNGCTYTFSKNTHTGTETMILAAVLAKGTTVIRNAAEEVEVDDLIKLLRLMGANVERSAPREITVTGVSALHGATYTIMPDRNEEVTFAIAAIASKGDITVHESERRHLTGFLDALTKAGGSYTAIDDRTTRYFYAKPLRAVDITTSPYPGFMTDWQAPWALLMTQATGISTIHETVFESRFSYVPELRKMGAHISYTDPVVSDPSRFYNFNWEDRKNGTHQAIAIKGPAPLHNAIVSINDLRAGATILLAALIANGESTILGIEQIDRGYEHIEDRLKNIGGKIRRVTESE